MRVAVSADEPATHEAIHAAHDLAITIWLIIGRGAIDDGLSQEECEAILRTATDLRQFTGRLVAVSSGL